MGDKIILGVHSNVPPDGDAGLTAGHAWISVTQDGKTQTYGLWPDDHPFIEQQGLSNGDGSDVRTGIESGIGREPAASRYYELTPEQFQTLQTELRRDADWGLTNTCASWASDVANKVTGERIGASELLGLTDTPRELSESIQELERERRTDKANPVQPSEVQPGSSSFSKSDTQIDLDRHPVARELRARFPESVSDAQVDSIAVRAIDEGIDSPDKVAEAMERDGELHVAGNTPGYRVSVGVQEQVNDAQVLNLQLAERSQQTLVQTAPENQPSLRMS